MRFVLRIKKINKALKTDMIIPSQRKGCEYHHKAKPETRTANVAAFLAELTAGFINVLYLARK